MEIYTMSEKGRLTSSILYTKTELVEIFGRKDAKKLIAGKKVAGLHCFYQLAKAFNRTGMTQQERAVFLR